MPTTDRRTFLKVMGSGAMAAALPLNLRKAMSVPAHNRTRSIQDIEHIVILTQENRSFDHYFGTMRGVRGFADPRAVRLPSGKTVWHQANGAGEVIPFRPPVENLGLTFLSDPPHGWNDGHDTWNGGRFDRWVPNKGLSAMTYHTRKDIPFHFALAEAFTLADDYHCSVMGPTDPNRYHLWTGWVGNDGKAGGPVITNAELGYDWSTYPERLQRNGISWKVYQDIGVGLTAEGSWGWTGDQPYIGNFGDNSLLYFHQYQNAAPGSPLAVGAKTGTNIAKSGTLFDQFRADVEAGTLPQVSYIAAPEAYSEHPNWPANFGAWYGAQFLEILASNPDLWSRTVFLWNYDEEGGFFDHVVPPTPPASPDQGASTVSTVNEIFPGDRSHPAGPYGLGIRVPMIAVSPWSRGGYVNSQVFDHTSVIKFLEARFGDGNPDLVESNITPWRRAVVGDLTTMFDFRNPNRGLVRLPDTAGFAPPDRDFHPSIELTVPASQSVPAQEKGVRPARPLPYALHASAAVDPIGGTVVLTFDNVGGHTAVFHVRSAHPADAPRSYTVEPGKRLTGTWSIQAGYDLSVHGPNGFFRSFVGTAAGEGVEVTARYGDGDELELFIANSRPGAVEVVIEDAYRQRTDRRTIAGGRTVRRVADVSRDNGWYDLTVTLLGSALRRQLAGHVENGEESTSDPLMGGMVGRS